MKAPPLDPPLKRGRGNANSAELSLLKFLRLTYHHSHFLATTLDFTFFILAFLGAALFLQLGCLGPIYLYLKEPTLFYIHCVYKFPYSVNTDKLQYYALVNSMPHPPTRGGWGNTGNLTNRGVKFPTTGAKSAVKSPLCPHPHSRGFDNTSRMTKRIFHSNKPAL